MMQSVPTQSNLTDLMTLLQLMQAASDPKKTQAGIELMQAERKTFDDAIAEAKDQQDKAVVTVRRSQEAVDAAAQADIAITAKHANLDARTVQINDMADRVNMGQKQLNEDRAEFTEKSLSDGRSMADRRSSLDRRFAELDARQKDCDQRDAESSKTMDEAKALKAEYEAKLEKIKALTA